MPNEALEKVESTFTTRDGSTVESWDVRQYWVKERIGRPYDGVVELVAQPSTAFSSLMSMSAEIDGVAIEAFDGFPVSLSRAL